METDKWKSFRGFLQLSSNPGGNLAKEIMNFNMIAPFGQQDTAKELRDHAAKTQDASVGAFETESNAKVSVL